MDGMGLHAGGQMGGDQQAGQALRLGLVCTSDGNGHDIGHGATIHGLTSQKIEHIMNIYEKDS
ncbi:MAG: hypothetical protein PW788_15605 [Micavibrio sp.]|nr:hypothetical protein [Micavibrio sp.]